MDRSVRDKEELLQAIARLDPIYQIKMRKGSALERKFDRITGKLDDKDRDLVWDFVMQNEDISQYVLYLACQYMEFKTISDDEITFDDDYDLRKAQAEQIARMIKAHKE